jgi:hypothetical protein
MICVSVPLRFLASVILTTALLTVQSHWLSGSTDSLNRNALLSINHPLVAYVKVDDEVKHAFAQLAREQSIDSTVEIVIRISRPTSAPAPGIRVFLNKPDATTDTPLDDIHYVGSVSLFPVGGLHEPEDSPFILDSTRTLRRLAAARELSFDTSTSITLVAVPGKTKAMPAPVSVSEVAIRVKKYG